MFKDTKRSHFWVLLETFELLRLMLITCLERNHSKSPCVCQPCHSGIFPRWACSNRPLSHVNPCPGIAHAKQFKAVNIKVNAMPVILTIFKAERQTHTHTHTRHNNVHFKKKQCCGVIAWSRKSHRICEMRESVVIYEEDNKVTHI